MAIEPVYTPIGRLFTQFIFQVPRYQRGYTWDDPQIDDYLRDLQRCFERAWPPNRDNTSSAGLLVWSGKCRGRSTADVIS